MVIQNMNDTSDIDDEDLPKSVDLAEAWSKFDDEVENANQPTEKVQAAERLCKRCAVAVAAGESEATADSLIDRASDRVGTQKRMLNSVFDEWVQKAEHRSELEGDGDGRYRLDILLRKKLDHIVVVRSTDHNTDTAYQWYFSEPYCVIETTGEHRDPKQFRHAYFDETGQHVKAPSDGIKQWYEWVEQFIDEQLEDEDGIGEVQESIGERTIAVNDVQQMLSNKQATTSLTEAVQTNRLYVKEEDADTVYVPNGQIDRVLSAHEQVNFRALQSEMDARGILTRTAKQTTTPEVSSVTIWCVDHEWIEPVEVIDDDGSGQLVVSDE